MHFEVERVYSRQEVLDVLYRKCRIDRSNHAEAEGLLHSLWAVGALLPVDVVKGIPTTLLRNPDISTPKNRRASIAQEAVIDEWNQVVMVRQGPEAEAMKLRIRTALHDRRKADLQRQLADLDAEPVAI